MTEPDGPYWIIEMSPDSSDLIVRSSTGVLIATVHPQADAAQHAALIAAAPTMHRLLKVSSEFIGDLAERESGLIGEIASGLVPSLTASLGQVESAAMVARLYQSASESRAKK